MRYHNITTDDMLNGDGLRTVLWVSGCSHCCRECQNPVTWDPNGGLIFDAKARQELFDKLAQEYIAGVTFSGGDPLYISNRADIKELAKEIRKKFRNKTIWMYTGFVWESIRELPVMKYIDVLVDGEFDSNRKNVNYPWCGSTNQRVIDVQKTLAEGKIVLHI